MGDVFAETTVFEAQWNHIPVVADAALQTGLLSSPSFLVKVASPSETEPSISFLLTDLVRVFSCELPSAQIEQQKETFRMQHYANLLKTLHGFLTDPHLSLTYTLNPVPTLSPPSSDIAPDSVFLVIRGKIDFGGGTLAPFAWEFVCRSWTHTVSATVLRQHLTFPLMSICDALLREISSRAVGKGILDSVRSKLRSTPAPTTPSLCPEFSVMYRALMGSHSQRHSADSSRNSADTLPPPTTATTTINTTGFPLSLTPHVPTSSHRNFPAPNVTSNTPVVAIDTLPNSDPSPSPLPFDGSLPYTSSLDPFPSSAAPHHQHLKRSEPEPERELEEVNKRRQDEELMKRKAEMKQKKKKMRL